MKTKPIALTVDIDANGGNEWLHEIRRRRAAQQRMQKALPQPQAEKPAKQLEPANKHQGTKAAKVAAKGSGRPRYTYPTEKKSAQAVAAKQEAVMVAPDGVDPQAFATKLGLSLSTLKGTVQEFVSEPKMGGREGFAKFMRSTVGKAFMTRNGVGDDYFGKLYDVFTKPPQQEN